MVDLLEALTIFCFGLSWPISIRKSLISRTAKGKSLFFEEGCIYNRDGMVRVAGFLSILGAFFRNLCHCNLYPVRGRKLHVHICATNAVPLQFIPRKGTET